MGIHNTDAHGDVRNILSDYGKCPKISYNKVANKMAYAICKQHKPRSGYFGRSSLIRLYTVYLSPK